MPSTRVSRNHALLLSIAALLSAGCRSTVPALDPPPVAADDRILADVAWLADAQREGRATGTPGNDSAAAYIARRFGTLGLVPLTVDTARAKCRVAVPPSECRTFLQRFVARGVELMHAGRPEGVRSQNVIALIPGSDPALRGQYLVIGAHYDHLGRSTAGAMDPEARDAMRNGADDNASGTAAVLELARRLAAVAPRRSVILAAFTGEELGLLGSQYFVDHSPVALDSIVAMLNFDMVGRLRNDRLIVYGTGTAAELPAVLAAANTAPALAINSVADGFGPSDQSSFSVRGIPVLHFFTDLHDQYHRATDVVALIDAPGEARVVTLAERVAREIADRPLRLSPIRIAPRAIAAAGTQGPAVYLGSIPDMGSSDAPGLKLSGVRAGSPADKGGLMAGDIIVAFGERTVTDLYSYTDALYTHRPGDTLQVTFLRAGVRRTTSVTLGTRGQ